MNTDISPLNKEYVAKTNDAAYNDVVIMLYSQQVSVGFSRPELFDSGFQHADSSIYMSGIMWLQPGSQLSDFTLQHLYLLIHDW